MRALHVGARNLRHGHTVEGEQSPEYRSWGSIKARCSNPKRANWHWHGGRGIKVCARWAGSFEAFRADVGPRPSPQHVLTRINRDGNFEPGNCRWATRGEEQKTKSLGRPPTPRAATNRGGAVPEPPLDIIATPSAALDSSTMRSRSCGLRSSSAILALQEARNRRAKRAELGSVLPPTPIQSIGPPFPTVEILEANFLTNDCPGRRQMSSPWSNGRAHEEEDRAQRRPAHRRAGPLHL
jgi:hypothetical protein